MDDRDEEDEAKDNLIIPSDVGEESEEEDEEQADKAEAVNEDEIFQEFEDIQPEPEPFVNEKMVKRIEKLEDKMVGEKNWQLKGEVQGKHRPVDSLLQEHLDFNVATKLPPTITKALN